MAGENNCKRIFHSGWRPTRLFAIPMLLVLLAIGESEPAHTHTFVQVGVDSNFVVLEDNLVFAQSDGSLTVLHIKTGKVIKRLTDKKYDGTLLATPHGLLLLNYEKASMLNPPTFREKWSSGSAHEANITANMIIGVNRYGLLECRKLSSGDVVWKRQLEEAVHLTTLGSSLLLFGKNMDTGETRVALMDALTGRNIFEKRSTEVEQLLMAWMSHTHVYIAAGRHKGSVFDSHFDEVKVFNLRGKKVGSLALEDAVRGKRGIDVDERHRVIQAGDVILHPSGLVVGDTPLPLDKGPVWLLNNFSISGRSRLPKPDRLKPLRMIHREDRAGSLRLLLEWKSKTANWRVLMRHVRHASSIAEVSVHDQYLILGTDTGQVECLNTRTGNSLWLYTFMASRDWMSWNSTLGPPPTKEDMKKDAKRRAKKRPKPKQAIRVPDSFSETESFWKDIVRNAPRTNGRIIIDPERE